MPFYRPIPEHILEDRRQARLPREVPQIGGDEPGLTPIEEIPLEALTGTPGQTISEPEAARHNMSLRSHGIPAGIATALSFALGAKYGVGPEAAALGLVSYGQGAQRAINTQREFAQRDEEIAQQGRQLDLTESRQQIGVLNNATPYLTGEGQAKSIGGQMGLAGIDPTGMSIQSRESVMQQERDLANQAKGDKIEQGIGLAMIKSGDWDGLEVLAGTVERYAPERASSIREIQQAIMADVAEEDAAVQAFAKAMRQGKDVFQVLGMIDNLSPDMRGRLLNTAFEHQGRMKEIGARVSGAKAVAEIRREGESSGPKTVSDGATADERLANIIQKPTEDQTPAERAYVAIQAARSSQGQRAMISMAREQAKAHMGTLDNVLLRNTPDAKLLRESGNDPDVRMEIFDRVFFRNLEVLNQQSLGIGVETVIGSNNDYTNPGASIPDTTGSGMSLMDEFLKTLGPK